MIGSGNPIKLSAILETPIGCKRLAMDGEGANMPDRFTLDPATD
jgi:hypothetical protein